MHHATDRIAHMVKDNSDSERGNLLPPPHGSLILTSSKGSFICIILDIQYVLNFLSRTEIKLNE